MSATIVVADDDDALRALFRRALERVGYRVLVASDGIAALAVIRTSHVDLLVTDLSMPDGEGIDLIRIVRDEQPSLMIIVISGAALDGDVIDGPDVVLSKPLSTEELVEAVRGFVPPGIVE